VTEMSPDEGKRAYRREMLLATALVAAGLAMSGVSLARIVAGNAHVAQATPPATIAPEPARPDPQAQKDGTRPTLPSAPAEKMAPPIPQK
jgi:hypothetical protein